MFWGCENCEKSALVAAENVSAGLFKNTTGFYEAHGAAASGNGAVERVVFCLGVLGSSGGFLIDAGRF